MFNIKVKKSSLIVTNKEPIAAGASKAYHVGFNFDEEWDGLLKNVIFKAGETSVAVLLEGSSCPIPWEVLSSENIGEKLWVGVYGSDSEGTKLPTVWNELEVIQAGAELCGSGSEPTPTAVSLIYETAKNALEEASMAKTHALAADISREKAEDAAIKAEAWAGSALNEKEKAKKHAGESQEAAMKAIKVCESSLYDAQRSEGEVISLPEDAFTYAKILSLEGNSHIENKTIVPSALSIEIDGVEHPIPEDITSLPDYGHGAGEGYNNKVDFESGIYTRRCNIFEPVQVYSHVGYPYFQTLCFPLSNYEECVRAIETIKCSHSELTFVYNQVATSNVDNKYFSLGFLVVIMNGENVSQEDIQAFIDEQRAAGTPVVVCHGLFDPSIGKDLLLPEDFYFPVSIETDISDLALDSYIPVTPGGEVTFDGGIGMLELFVPKSLPDKNYVSATCSNALRGTLYGSSVSADDVSPLEHELDVKVSSKNLIPFPYYKTDGAIYEGGTTYGVTVTVDNGVITLNGTCEGVTVVQFDIIKDDIVLKEDAVLSGCPVGGNHNTTYAIQAVVTRPEGTKAYPTHIGNDGISIPKGSIVERVFIIARPDYVFDNIKFCPQIEYGRTATPYTLYVADTEGTEVSVTDGENTQSAFVDAEGNVKGLKSASPSMTLTTDNAGTVIECTYNKDANKVIEQLTNAIISLGGNI